MRFAVLADDGDPFLECIDDAFALVAVGVKVVVAEEVAQAHVTLVGEVVDQNFKVAIEAVGLEVKQKPIDILIIPGARRFTRIPAAGCS